MSRDFLIMTRKDCRTRCEGIPNYSVSCIDQSCRDCEWCYTKSGFMILNNYLPFYNTRFNPNFYCSLYRVSYKGAQGSLMEYSVEIDYESP